MWGDGPWCPDWTPLRGMVQVGSVALWHGAPGSGKSLVALHAIAALLSGEGARVLGRKVRDRPVPGDGVQTEHAEHRCLYVSLEDTANQVEGRVRALTAFFGLDPTIWNRARMVCGMTSDPKRKAAAIEAAIAELNPTVIVIDNLRRFDAEAEREAATAQPVIETIERLAREHGAAIVLIHHDRKMPGQGNGKSSGDEMASGSGALIGAARLAVQFHKESDDVIAMNGGKSNHGPNAGQAMWRLVEGQCNGWGVVVAEPMEMPKEEDVFEGLNKVRQQEIVRALLDRDAEDRRVDCQSPGGAIFAVGAELELEPVDDLGLGVKSSLRTSGQTDNRKRMEKMLAAWCNAGALRIKEVPITIPGRRGTAQKQVFVQGRNGLLSE